MLHQAGYNVIQLYSATKGMNQDIGTSLIPADSSYYIQNIMPDSLGEGKVRFGTALFSDKPQDTIVDFFPFKDSNGAKQQIIYMSGYQAFTTFSNFRIVSANHIRLTSVNYALFKPDTFLQLRYITPKGISPVSFYEIRNVSTAGLPDNTIDIEVYENSFPDELLNFFILAPGEPEPVYISGTQFSITVPDDFIASFYYEAGNILKLTINGVDTLLTLSVVDISVPGTITFTCVGTPVPSFVFFDTRVLSFKSSTPDINTISNSYGYIKVLDVATNALLTAEGTSLENLSVACQPRAEYFGQKLWICNGVDPIMTWDGTELKIYTEFVKEFAQTFNWIDTTHFSFIAAGSFDEDKYEVGTIIKLIISGRDPIETTIVSVTELDNLVTIETTAEIAEFTGANRVSLFYTDMPPPFSYMKAAHDRLWCLGTGAVSLNYRIPDQSMRFFYSYTPYTNTTNFRFFNEETKTVPSEDISAKHGCADNLEAIVSVSGYLAFIGRQETQIWQGIDPVNKGASNALAWASTLPVGVFHGDLVVELANDAYFLSPNGYTSFSTLNIAKQFGATSTANMDNIASEYMDSINSNIAYRACRSFKYNSGGFCGFKVGQNDIIVSRFHTNLYWWGIFSGDFSKATSFLSSLDDSLYIAIGKNIYQYADGFNGEIKYGDNDGKSLITFIETKYVNNIKSRYANKRYEIQCDYSSNVIVNTDNVVNIYIRGDLRTSFTLSDLCDFHLRGDILGTINLLSGDGVDNNYPPSNALGFRLDSPFQTVKGRLQFLSSNFSVSLVGFVKNGPFVLKRIRLFGILER